MSKTSLGARQHIKTWSKFFADVTSVGGNAIEEFLQKQKRRKYMRQSLERLINRGFLKKSSDKLRVTVEGRSYFRKVKARTKSEIPTKTWDGKWRLIAFDVPGGYNAKRNHMRALLREFDFVPIQKSVWISPHGADEALWKLLVETNLDQYCKAMVVDILEGSEELCKQFGLTPKGRKV